MSLSSSPEKMSTPQQKLKMRMVANDTWSTREQLCLASSVLRSGDQNWNSVSRSLKPFSEPNRPSDWLSPKNCALQYNTLLEKTGAHKRKRGERHPSTGSSDSQQSETAGEIILRQLTQDRIEELQQLLETSRKEYHTIQTELELVKSGKIDDKLVDICKKIDDEHERKLREQAAHLKWIEEREKKQQELKQANQLMRSPSKTSMNQSELTESELAINSPSVTDQLNIDVTTDEVREVSTTEVKTPTGSTATPVAPAATPSSPLLTSLLRSPTATSAGTPIGSASKLSLIGSPNAMSPGLKNLVSNAIAEETSPSKTVNTSPSSGAAAPTLTRLLELPPNSPGKPLPELTVTEETEVSTAVSPSKSESRIDEEEEKPTATEEIVPAIAPDEEVTVTSTEVAEAEPIESSKISEEIVEIIPETVVESDEVVEVNTTKEEVPATEPMEEEDEKEPQNDINIAFENEVEVAHNEEPAKSVEDSSVEPPSVPKSEHEEEEEAIKEEPEKEVVEEEHESADEKVEEKEVEEEEEVEDVKEVKPTEPEAVLVKPELGTPQLSRKPTRSMRRKGRKNVETTSSEEKSKAAEPGPTTRRSSGRKGPSQPEESEPAESFGEPIDVTPTSSLGKKRAPPPPPLYVPASPSPAPSSGVDSTPNSPTSSVSTITDEHDKEYRSWKKAILLLWREISSHKHASLFAKPITDEQAHGYKGIVLRPIDLSTIKKSIESGAIRTTAEFQREVFLMFLNAIVYNPNHHEVNRLAKEMFTETSSVIQDFINHQMLANQNMESSRPHRRETRDLARRTESLSSHEETPLKPDEGKTRAAKRASATPHVDDASAKPKRRSRAAQNEKVEKATPQTKD